MRKKSIKKIELLLFSVQHFFRWEKNNYPWLFLSHHFFFTFLLWFTGGTIFLSTNIINLSASEISSLTNELEKNILQKDYRTSVAICESLRNHKKYNNSLKLNFLCGKSYLFMDESFLKISSIRKKNLLKENQQIAKKYFDSVIQVLKPLSEKQKKMDELLLQSLFYRASVSYLYGSLDESIHDLKIILKFSPYHKQTLFNLIVCLEEKSEIDSAARYFLRLKEIDKDFINTSISNHQ